MIGWVRGFVVILLLCSVIYVVLSFNARRRERARLRRDYELNTPETDKADFMAEGMEKYDRSLKPKLFLSVFAFPIIIMTALYILAQYG